MNGRLEQIKHRSKRLLLKSNGRFTGPNLIAFVAAIGLIGGLLLTLSHAAGFFVSVEPETGTLTSPATTGNDSNASGGKYVQFGGSSSAGTYPPQHRFIYDSSSYEATVASDGWNLMDCGSKSCADSTPPGTQALIWVGDYDNTTCSWQQSDTTVSSQVKSTVGDSKVYGYFIDDEPNPYACPNAPAQNKARSDLVHSVDPNMKTLIVLDSNGFKGQFTSDAYQQFPLWVGTADYLGLDPYPCTPTGCNWTFMDNMIAAADSAGLPYWGISQAFTGTPCGENAWPWPSAADLTTMLTKWKNSHEVGYGTFAWNWSACSSDLSTQPGLISVLKSFNLGQL